MEILWNFFGFNIICFAINLVALAFFYLWGTVDPLWVKITLSHFVLMILYRQILIMAIYVRKRM